MRPTQIPNCWDFRLISLTVARNSLSCCSNPVPATAADEVNPTVPGAERRCRPNATVSVRPNLWSDGMKNLFYTQTALFLATGIWVMGATVTETLVSPAAAHFPQNKQNESPMAVNPTDANNAISGANDEIEESDCTLVDGGSNCQIGSAA